MTRKSSTPPPNRRVSAPENRRSTPKQPRVPLRARVLVWRERMRVRFAGLRRVLSVLLGIVLGGAAVAGLLACGKLVERHLRTSPAFAAKTVNVSGGVHHSPESLRKIAGVHVGKNVFEVGPELATARLLDDPWIETASVSRRLPGHFEIEVRERKPMALLALDKLYLVGEDGSAFKPLEASDPADLPIITGIAPEDVQRDKQASAARLVSAIALLHDYRDAGLLRQKSVSEIHADEDGSLALYVGEDATYVRMGKPPFRSKLRHLREVLSTLARKKTQAAYVYLDNERRPDRVTVRLR